MRLKRLRRWETLSILGIVISAGILRLQNLNKVFREAIIFDGYDSYYHLRLAEIIVKKGERIVYDSYLNYPYGLKISWLPLYHWIISIPGILIGYTATEVFAVLLPVVMGVVSVVVVYLIAYEVTSNRYIALISSLITATTPKLVFISSVGNSDYHAWNLSLFLISVFFLVKGINTTVKLRRLMFLLSGIFTSVLSLSWLGGSIYTLILALMCVPVIKDGKMDFPEYSLVFLMPAIVSLSLPLSRELFMPYFGIWLYLFLVDFGIKLGLRNTRKRRANAKYDNGADSEDKGIRLKEGKEVEGGKERVQRETIVVSTISLLFVIAIAFLYFLNFPLVRGGLNYILGINPYLPTIAEARSFQVLLMVVESGIFAFLIAVPSAVVYFMRRERGYEMLSLWVISALILTLMQIRFVEVFAPALAIFSGYGVAAVLQASNIPVLDLVSEGKDGKDGKEVGGSKKRKNSKKGKDKSRKRAGKNKEEFEWGKTEIAYTLFIIAFVSSTGIVYSFKGFDISKDWLNALRELREISPKTSYYLSPNEEPEYSVLSWWDYGNWIVYLSERPVVCNNFQAGAKDSATFFATANESVAKEIVRKRGVKYIITDKKMLLGNETIRGKFQAILKIAGYDGDPNQILEVYRRSMLYKLHVEEAKNLEWVRIVSRHGDVKIFEVID
jgi:dolichyl-diphosphooligosaccharide--protein glycosyltransferase